MAVDATTAAHPDTRTHETNRLSDRPTHQLKNIQTQPTNNQKTKKLRWTG